MIAAGLAALTALSGCATKRSAEDSAMLYQRYSEYMTLSGRFRSDTKPEDAPYSRADLKRNFLKVVFEPELQLARFYAARAGERRLSRWERPIRYRLIGDGVRDSDRAAFSQLARTLSKSSGLRISESPEGAGGPPPNVNVFVISAKARDYIAAFEEEKSWYDSSILRDWVETLNPPCFALFDAGSAEGGEIVDGAIFIKAELENPLRQACFVEEFTQSLGLVFDHDDVRPSIFNDDQEFIALTEHDLALLKILYDRRLAPGMTQSEAAAALEKIVGE